MRSLGVCDKCSYTSKVGDKTTIGWGGLAYCQKCITSVDDEFKKFSSKRQAEIAANEKKVKK